MTSLNHTWKPLSHLEIREKFIAFFRDKLGADAVHCAVPSASLIPANNPTVMLTPAGMLPFVPMFLGLEPAPTPPRLVSIQKCARVSGKASDLESVGRTRGHHTAFEMLGNFAFGDYFKSQMIPWAWQLITQEFGLPPERLYVSVFQSDDETFDIWTKTVGLPAERVIRCGEKDNFWGPPGATGPCGPCSEIYFDFGADYDTTQPHTNHDTSTHPVPINLDSPRYLEIWNLVFMELFQDSEGQRVPLAQKNVDTGMGLERIALVLQGAKNTFETDLFLPLIHALAAMTGTVYGQQDAISTALKIVVDHTRFLVWVLADGVLPSNDGRGYIARMILRRAVRFARQKLGVLDLFLADFAAVVVAHFAAVYPELEGMLPRIQSILSREETRFIETLERGIKQLDALMSELKATKTSDNQGISGDVAFMLYDTYGFPVEMTQDIAEEAGLRVDKAGFDEAMAAQKARARAARKSQTLVDNPVYADLLATLGATQFVGYDTLSQEATVLALIQDGELVEEVSGTNTSFEAVLDVTPFYGESGGQVGDRGVFSREVGHHGLTVVVKDTQKVGDLVVHQCLFDNGEVLRVGETLMAQVEPSARHRAAIHHTATHLVNAALRKVLHGHGLEITQAGSRVSPEGARFDFTCDRPVSPEQLGQVEWLVNSWIQEDPERQVHELSIEAARESGALMMATEKYGQVVRVVVYGPFSKELCGGTHLERLGHIGLVKIVTESAIAAGVRRLEFVAGELALKQVRQESAQLSRLATLLKISRWEAVSRVEKMLDEHKQHQREQEGLLTQLAQYQLAMLVGQYASGSGETPQCPKILVHQVLDLPADSASARLKSMAEQAENSLGKNFALFLATQVDDRVQFACAVSDSVVKVKGWKAGDVVKQAASLCGGGGGGKPTMALAGGRDVTQLEAAIEAVRQQWAL
ncbi:MAG: alanine--tRNA ligase [Vampirovibrionales bacterium]|nr:alanine--tRNA ligase [Vampirovibrionales bacterium]